LVADGLTKILERGQMAGVLQGIGDDLLQGKGIRNFNYADEGESHLLANLKWALLGFEQLSGLKINYEKSELIGQK
jgi:hypothetical protein